MVSPGLNVESYAEPLRRPRSGLVAQRPPSGHDHLEYLIGTQQPERDGVATVKWRIHISTNEPFTEMGMPAVPVLRQCIRSEGESDDHYTVEDEGFFQMVRVYQNPILVKDTACMRFDDHATDRELVISVPHHGEIVDLDAVPVDTRDRGGPALGGMLVPDGGWEHIASYTTTVINNFLAGQLADAKRECDDLLPCIAERMEAWLGDNEELVEREAYRTGRELFDGFLDEVLPGRWRDPYYAHQWEPDDYALFAHVNALPWGSQVNKGHNLAFTVALLANLGDGLGGVPGGNKRTVELGRMLAQLYSVQR